MTPLRAVIIGAGIGGLTAAIALRRSGIDVSVHERATAPSEVGAGISIWGNAMRVFDTLGVGEAIATIGEPLRVGEMRLANGRIQSRIDMERLDRELGVRSYILHRAELQAALLAALPADRVHYGDDLSSIACTDDVATATFTDGRRIEGDCILGADGQNSKTREFVVGEPSKDPLRYSGYTCWRGVVDDADLVAIPPGYVSESWGRGSRFGVIRMSRNRIYWFATRNAPRHIGPPTRIDRAAVDEVAREYHAPIPRIVERTPDSAILRHDLLDRIPRRGWSRRRVVLLGDAAHPTTPNIGQGGCLAIEDAFVLARELAQARSLEEAFARYEAARFARCAEITEFSWRMGIVGQLEHGALRAIRDLVFRWTPQSAIAARHRRYVGFDVGVSKVGGSTEHRA